MSDDVDEIKHEWISVDDKLPEEGKHVLVRLNKNNWFDSRDQENVNTVKAILEIGISEKEREELPDNNRRKTEYHRCDIHGNNLVPYGWDTFGASYYFGQEVTHWMPLPNPPHKDQY